MLQGCGLHVDGATAESMNFQLRVLLRKRLPLSGGLDSVKWTRYVGTVKTVPAEDTGYGFINSPEMTQSADSIHL